MDLRRERDIEQLRRIALAQGFRLNNSCACCGECRSFRTKATRQSCSRPALVETLTTQRQAAPPQRRLRSSRQKIASNASGLSTEHRNFPPKACLRLDALIEPVERRCALCPMAGQFEESE